MFLKLIPKSSKYYYRFLLTVLFISIGFVISFISMIVSTYYQVNSIHEEFDRSAKSTLSYKKDYLYEQTNNFKNYISAIDRTPEFNNFIQSNPKEFSHIKEHITGVMLAISHSHPNIMQFRFIGAKGCEAIRIDRDSIGSTPYTVSEKLLQNKKDRYYFKETKDMLRGAIWFSNIDLNIEHGEIVKPIVPTLRVAKAYYVNNEFRGILIINIFMEKILKEVMKSELFNVAMIDKDKHILTNNLRSYKKNERKWTKYLRSAKDTRYSTFIDEEEKSSLLNILF